MTLTLIISSLIAGILNGVGSSGGMLLLSVMLLNGFHPVVATATNKIIALVGSIGAIKNYFKHTEGIRSIKMLLLFSILGTIVGALVVLTIREEILGKIYTLLIVLLIVILFKIRVISIYVTQNLKMSREKYYMFVGLLSGTYNGFFGPGTIIMTSIPLNMLDGYTEKRSLSTATILNTITNAVACIILGSALFSIFEVEVGLLVLLIIANIIGQYLGSLFIVKIGEKYINLISNITLTGLFFILIIKYWA